MVQPNATRNALHELGYKIFLDRYAQKDVNRESLDVGDIVIVVVNPQTGQREIGTVQAIALPTVTIKLNDGEIVERDIANVDKPIETQPEQLMERVARGVAEIEATPEKRQEWQEKFRWLLDDWKFVPGGRILTAAGTDQSLTYYNCYVLPSPHDSREGIMTTLTQMTEIMSRGGGVGMNLSTLRPRHAYVKGVNGRSSGSVSWGALYSFVTGLIEQGGCFGPDERIATDKGLIPAAELADRIDAGETFQAQTHKGLREITARFRNGIKPLYEVTTSRGYTVRITEDHKVAVLMDGEIATMPLKYLQEGDEILLLLSDDKQFNESLKNNQAEANAAVQVAVKHDELVMHTEADTIESIEWLGDSEVFDFEVDDVHLLSGNGIYTSNSRRGALMLILNDWHPDVFDFINSKRQAGNITNANISVGVSDSLMEAVKSDGDWELVFPDTDDPDYDELWDGDLDTWVNAGRKVQHYKTIKARDLWNAIIESAWASAEPGVWFRERSNKMANSWYFNPLVSTNPCITGDTRIYTNKGMIPARELFDDETEISVAIDGRFGLDEHVTPSTRVFMTGTKPIFRLQTREGYYLRATADHRIMTPRGWVELQDLTPGDKIHILNRKGGFGQEGNLELGRVLGWLIGDGTIKQDRAVLSFFGEEKQELAPMFAGYVNELVEPMTATARTYTVGVVDVTGRDEARVHSDRLRQLVADYGLTMGNKHFVPEVVFRGTEEMQRGFLQALFTADGGFQDGGEKGGSIRLAQSNLELLEQAQQLLTNFGIASRLYRNRRNAMYRELPDGKGSSKEYWTKDQHELVISKHNMVVFHDEIGFLMDYKQEALKDYITRGKRGPYRESFTATIESIEEDGIEEVFDLTEPKTSSFIANSLVIHNCGEQALGEFSVCNLGAINLSRYYNDQMDDVDLDLLDKSVRYATRFLDNVIDTTPYFFEQNRQVQESERRVGLGTMGIAELMINCGVRYGSDESVEFIDRVYSTIAQAAYETSAELAAEKGAFPQFDAEKFLESGFMQTMPESVHAIIQDKGIRNVTLLTQAPTGTTGTMVNTSTGIEPFFSWVYYRKSRLGLHEESVPIVQRYYDEHPEAVELPEYFVTAMDLAPEEHVKVQAAFQRWIDSAISKTCNVPNEYSVEQVSDLYMMMYDLGCKGGTIYRDGSRDQQVLMLKGDDRAESEMDDIKGKKESKAEKTEKAETQVTTPHRIYPRPVKLSGTTVSFKTPFGTSYITMNSDELGNPFEVFITVGKAGSDIQADAEAMGRMISLQLRTTAPPNRLEMLKLIVDQLQDIGGARPIGLGPNRVLSLPDAVARALSTHYVSDEEPKQLDLFDSGDVIPATTIIETAPELTSNGYVSGADMCPECGTISLIRAEGCRKCLTCGYSEC